MRIMNWDDKEFLLRIAPSRLKGNLYGSRADGNKIFISDDVSKK